MQAIQYSVTGALFKGGCLNFYGSQQYTGIISQLHLGLCLVGSETPVDSLLVVAEEEEGEEEVVVQPHLYFCSSRRSSLNTFEQTCGNSLWPLELIIGYWNCQAISDKCYLTFNCSQLVNKEYIFLVNTTVVIKF